MQNPPATDIFGHVITNKARGRNAEAWVRGRFDLTEEEGDVWAEFGYSTKRVIAHLIELREIREMER